MRFPKHEAKLLQPGAFCSRFVKNEAKPKGILPCFPSSRPGGRDPVELKKKAPPKSISDVNTKVAPFIQSVLQAKNTSFTREKNIHMFSTVTNKWRVGNGCFRKHLVISDRGAS